MTWSHRVCTQSPGDLSFIAPEKPPFPTKGTRGEGHPGPTGCMSGSAGAAGSDLSPCSLCCSHPPASSEPLLANWEGGRSWDSARGDIAPQRSLKIFPGPQLPHSARQPSIYKLF